MANRPMLRRLLAGLLAALALSLVAAAAARAVEAPMPQPTPAPAPAPSPPATSPSTSPGGSTTPAPQPAPGAAQRGIEALVPPPDNRHGNQALLAERYPALAYTPFNFDLRGLAGLPLNPLQESQNLALNVWASLLMALLMVVASFSASLLQWAFALDLVSGAGGPLAGVVGGLREQVYLPLLPVAMVLVGLWLGWQLLFRGRALRALEGAGWALAVVVGAAVYMAAPVELMSGVNGLTAALARGVLGAVASVDPRLQDRASDPHLSQGSAADAEVRVFVDRYWRTYVFTPWSVATFGSAQDGQRYGEKLLAQRSGQASDFDQAFEQASAATKQWYAGERGGERFAIVGLALVVVVLASLLYLLVAGMVVVAQLALLLLLMLGPLFLLAGVHPGAGRRMCLRWLEMLAGALMVRVVASAFLAVMVVLGGVVTETAAAAGWGVEAALQLALVLAAWIYRKPFMRVFGQVAAPRLAVGHVSSSRPAEVVHGFLDRGALALRRRQLASTAGAVRTAAAARGGAQAAGAARTAGSAGGLASGVALPLLALEAARLGVRGMERAKRGMQDAAQPFILGGPAPTPRQPRFRQRPGRNGSAAVRVPRPAPAPRPARQPGPAPERSAPSPQAGARSYRHWRTGEVVTTASSKIVLPGGWQRLRRP